MLAAEFQGCVTQNICELGMHENLLSQQYRWYASWTWERSQLYNAKVAHFARSVNRLVINTAMNVTRVDITQYNAGALSYRYSLGSWSSLDQSSSLSRLLCKTINVQ